jgi:NAD(P)H dehydrogenase (quinone)
MKILIVYAHPETKSMNGTLFTTSVQHLRSLSHEVKTSDLYQMKFNPVSDRSNFTTVLDGDFFKQQLEEVYATRNNGFSAEIKLEQEKVEWCDLMIWQFPLWWFSVPAILKGWVDRVFAMGRFYDSGHIYSTGMFKGKKAMLSLTTGGAEDAYLDGGFHGEMAGILKPVHKGIFEFTGFSVLEQHVVYGPVRKTPEELAMELERWKNRLSNIFEEDPVVVNAY